MFRPHSILKGGIKTQTQLYLVVVNWFSLLRNLFHLSCLRDELNTYFKRSFALWQITSDIGSESGCLAEALKLHKVSQDSAEIPSDACQKYEFTCRNVSAAAKKTERHLDHTHTKKNLRFAAGRRQSVRFICPVVRRGKLLLSSTATITSPILYC